MDGHPRHDGEYTFYQILSLYKGKPDSKWSRYNYSDYIDQYEFPETVGFEKCVTMQSGGDVWQSCGIHGTKELDYAKIVLRLVRKRFPEHRHKIVRRTVTMNTEDIDA